MKEIKEKVELTEEIFDNILVMMRSSTEDFFIALNTWKNLERTLLADIVLYKYITFAKEDIVNEIPRLAAWLDDYNNSEGVPDIQILMLYNSIDHTKISELDKKLFKRLCHNYLTHMHKMLDLDKIIDMNININWKKK